MFGSVQHFSCIAVGPGPRHTPALTSHGAARPCSCSLAACPCPIMVCSSGLRATCLPRSRTRCVPEAQKPTHGGARAPPLTACPRGTQK